ncbi:type II secretion system minor pseudopilin GspJ [Sphingomonas endophytica]|uniref:type II secretion system minor pseudopilin GspJ n=1 Tax=Sphingomonas endophytica TaxID=869719 RepID=UPI0009F91CBC|nr:type II secretion system minor pseudopilin GspJ [Sphingomonas endophytica]
MSARPPREAGFTLVEVMIALMIFGMIAAAGVALLAFSVRAQGAMAAALDDNAALNRLVSIMTADLAQAQDRPTRDVTGTLFPAFSGDRNAQPMLRLVRGGWSNPDQAPRATLQKVEYRLSAEGIERVAYPALDGAAPLPAALLLDRVQEVRVRFRYAGAWSDTWQGDERAALPQAMELTVVRGGGQSYRLLFLVGTGAPRAAEGQGPQQGGGPGTPQGAIDAPR